MTNLLPNSRAILIKGQALIEQGQALIEQGRTLLLSALGQAAPAPLPEPEPEFVSLKEAARQIGCSVDTVKRWCRKHDIGGPIAPSGPWSVDLARLRAVRRYRGSRSD